MLLDLSSKRPTLYLIIPSGNLLVNNRENNQFQVGTVALLSKQIILGLKSLKSCYPDKVFYERSIHYHIHQSRTISTSETDINLHFGFHAVCSRHKPQQLGQNHRHTTHPAQGAETLVNPLVPITGRHILVFG